MSGNWLTNCCWALGSVATWSIWRSNLGVGPRLAAAWLLAEEVLDGDLESLGDGAEGGDESAAAQPH